MSTPAPIPGSFEFLVAGLIGVLDEIAAAVGSEVQVRRYGSQDAHVFPSMWIDMDRAATTHPDMCDVLDEIPWRITYAVDPTAFGQSGDLSALERVVDIAVPLVDRAMTDAGARLGVDSAKRTYMTTMPLEVGEATVFVLVLGVQTDWSHPTPNPGD